MNYLIRFVMSVLFVTAAFKFAQYIGANPYNAIAIFAAVKVMMMDLK